MPAEYATVQPACVQVASSASSSVLLLRTTMIGHIVVGGISTAEPPQMPKARGSFPQLDLRGERVDAAIALAEKFLDDALRAGTDGVLVIHGHGTGALRDRLREHLRLFPGVSAIRPGAPDEGGDGVTVALLE